MFGRPRKSHTEKDHLDLYSLYVAAAREAWPGKELKVMLRYMVLKATATANFMYAETSNSVITPKAT